MDQPQKPAARIQQRAWVDPKTIAKPQQPEVLASDIQDLRELIAARKARQLESLNLYEPLPYQDEFHAQRAKEVLLSKANQVGGPQDIATPVLTPSGWRRIGDLVVGDEVFGSDGNIAKVVSVEPQGWLPIFELTFDDGVKTNCAENHFWKCKLKSTERFKSHKYYKPDKWGVYSLREIREHGGDDPKPYNRAVIPTSVVKFPHVDVPLDPYLLGVLLGDGCVRHGAVSFTSEDVEIVEDIEKVLPAGMYIRVVDRPDNGNAKSYHLSRSGTGTNPITVALRALGVMECRSEEKFVPREYLMNSVDVRLGILQGLMDTDGYCAKNGVPFFYSCSPQLANDVVFLVRSLGGKAKISWKETFIRERIKKAGRPTPKPSDYEVHMSNRGEPMKRCLNMAVVQFSMPSDVPVLRLDRKSIRRAEYGDELTTGRVLQTIRPSGNAMCVCIGVDSPDNTYITEDFIVTHNSLSSFVEVARCLTGRDPYDKYPKTTKTGKVVCIGYGEKHIGTVIYRYLFRWGSFKIIRDEVTGDWRTYHPWAKDRICNGKYGDLHRAGEERPAPPLIDKRFIEGKIAWQKRALDVFVRVKFTTGWELYAYNSEGDPSHAQGLTDVHLVLFDEDVAKAGWYEEMVQRTSSVNGLIRWNAMPHSRTDDIRKFIQRGEEEKDREKPRTVVIVVRQDETPFLSDEAKENNARIALSDGEDVYRRRILGELTTDSVLMYSSFDKYVHNAVQRYSEAEIEQEKNGIVIRSDLQRIFHTNNYSIPKDWTRYIFVDPGHTIAAAVFVATPPPTMGEWRLVYNELYIRKNTADIFAQALKKAIGDDVIHDFIIDMHGGHLRGAGGFQWIHEYQAALEKYDIKCERRGSRFGAGCDDIKLREEKLRAWLATRVCKGRENGYPTLYIDMTRCPNLVRELLAFCKKTVRQGGIDVVIDEANRRYGSHATESLEYAAAHGCMYVKPPPVPEGMDPIERLLKDKKRRMENRRYRRALLGGESAITLGPQG